MNEQEFNIEVKPLPKAVPKDQGFEITFLRNRMNNRRAFLASFVGFIVMIIVFSVLISSYSANAYLIIGLILSVSGVFVSSIRISLGCLGLQSSVLSFVRSMFFFGEIFIGVSAIFLFIQNMSAAVGVCLLFVCFVVFVVYDFTAFQFSTEHLLGHYSVLVTTELLNVSSSSTPEFFNLESTC